MTSYFDAEDSSTVFIPSKRWASVYDFFRDVKPTFFEGYTIEISTSESIDDCYNKSFFTTLPFLLLLALCFILL